LAAPLSALGLSGCHGAATPEPDTLFQSIYADYLHGSLDAAEARAAEARKEFSGGGVASNRAWALKFRLLDAEILLRQSHPGAVIALLIEDGVVFPREGDLAIKLNLLCGLAHSRLDQADKSNQELHEARRLAEASQSALIGDVLRAEGLIQRDSGNLVVAMEKFKSSLVAAREHSNHLLEALDRVDLGFVSLLSGHYDQAVVLSQEAANFAKSIQARRQSQIALGNLGWAYYDLGDFDNALVNFQAAEQQANEIGMVSSRVLWLQDAGLAAHKLGNLAAAKKYDEDALQLVLTLPASDQTNQIVNIDANLALLLHGEGDDAAAKTYSDAATLAARDSKDVNVVAYAKFIQGLLVVRQDGGQDAERVLEAARQLATDPEIQMDVENALANLYAGRQQSRLAELWYHRSIGTFEQNRSSIQSVALRLSFFGYGDAIYRDYAEFLIDSHRPIEALQLLDRSRARTLEEGLGFADAQPEARSRDMGGAQAVARKLDAAILFYSLGPKRSYLWAITARGTQLFILPKEREIKFLVEEYQKAIQKSIDPLQTANPAALSLYDLLIKPAAAMIPAGSKIFVIADGILHGLNFETLIEPSAQGLKYWIEDVTVTATSSIRILSRLQIVPDAAPGNLLLIGNPVSAGAEFEALPNASAEIELIQQHFAAQGQSVYTQARAVPAAYAASGPDQFRYIHFVAHGTASRLSPLDSAVVLSPTQNHPEDFKLYARDIVQHPLRARLVTISACYGSGLRTYAGEGLVGLAWAFLRAGSHNVIGALWQVDDSSTPLLMDRLYGELQAGKTPDAALRIAKLSLIHSANVFRKPFYWGAFELYAGS
jgi:CHAT domain-containing protein